MGSNVALPPGFKLDTPEAPKGPELPKGFTLDQPRPEESFDPERWDHWVSAIGKAPGVAAEIGQAWWETINPIPTIKAAIEDPGAVAEAVFGS